MPDLLDPRNDYVFKRLFAEAPDLLVALINDLRPDLPDITAVAVLNPHIDPWRPGWSCGWYGIIQSAAETAMPRLGKEGASRP